jgi:radical SAM protein with 4Fe4S-binding SPASM domain
MAHIWNFLERRQAIKELFHRFRLDDQFDSVIIELVKRGFLVLSQFLTDKVDSDYMEFSEARWTHLAIFPTQRCNLKCKYCYASGGDRHTVIERDYVDTILAYFFEKLSDQNGATVGLDFHGGGEPTFAFEIIKYAVEHFIEKCEQRNLTYRFGMATNGCFGDNVFDWLVNKNFDLTISFDGPPNIQNSQRPFRDGSGSHDLVTQNLRRLLKKGMRIAVRSTITAENVVHVCDVVRYIASFGVKFIHLEPCFEVGRCLDQNVKQPELEIFLNEFLEAFQWSISSGVYLKTASLRATEYPHNRFCGACGSNLAITPEGNLSTCYEVVTSDDHASEMFFIGRVSRNKRDSLSVFIDQEKLNMLSKRTVERMPSCLDCFSRYWCAGDCPVKSYRDTGSLYDVSPERCAFIRRANESIIKMILDDTYFPTSQMNVVEYLGG